ncbi:hypothetical protein T552_02587 [Pneumocystis carinii B80]|uniref:ZW10 C-terminal helical domain-containing protein n=1 Tax=Pneumocystis carinii (strain B80) TaxID=1408658 RepID=A0A0W4ZFE0_PNEC8|nr:hypothetical protein T552_02587 [Pneumocystis carinii B80]KTW27095.1 hypothetical protein T552_02587 [Pneumocystis carinii B80]
MGSNMVEISRRMFIGGMVKDGAEKINKNNEERILNDMEYLEGLKREKEGLNVIFNKIEVEIKKTGEKVSRLILENEGLFKRRFDQKREIYEKIRELISNMTVLMEIERSNEEILKTLNDKNEGMRELIDSIEVKKALKETILKIKFIASLIDKAEDSIVEGDLFRAFDSINEAEIECKNIRDEKNVVILSFFKEKISGLKLNLIERCNDIWEDFVRFEDEFIVKKQLKGPFQKKESMISFIELSRQFEIFDLHMINISNYFVSRYFQSVLSNKENFYTLEWSENDEEYQLIIKIDTSKKKESIFPSLFILINFIEKVFPSIILSSLSKHLFPKIQSFLTNDYINDIIPDGIDGLDKFNRILLEGFEFNKEIKQTIWNNSLEIEKWIKQASETWIMKMKSNSIDLARKVLKLEDSNNIIIEHIQNTKSKQVVNDEKVDSTDNNDWDLDWENEDKEIFDDEKNEATIEHDTWKLDNDIEDNRFENDQLKDESWDWNDDDDDDDDDGGGDQDLDTKKHHDMKDIENKRSDNDFLEHENYAISFFPKKIIPILQQHLSYIKELMKPQYKNYMMASFFPQLSDSIILILNTYRALVSLHCNQLLISPMLLYNDFIYFSEYLQELYDGSTEFQCILEESNNFREAGNFTYFLELKMQKKNVISILERTHGFVDCTDKQQIEICSIALCDLQKMFQTLSESWRKILTRETLFESIGWLLEVVVVYIITAIKDISDISEEESNQLSILFNQFAQIEDIFTVENQMFPVTPTYVPSWLKFRYLLEILEASMQDVMYLYNSGALVDFEKEEIIDLLKTLFADTPNRAENILKIRNS